MTKLGLVFQLRLVIQIEGCPRDVTGVVGDAFQHRGHFGNGHHEPKIARGRLAQREDINALPVDFDLKLIDLVIVIQNRSRCGAVAPHQRLHGPP